MRSGYTQIKENGGNHGTHGDGAGGSFEMSNTGTDTDTGAGAGVTSIPITPATDYSTGVVMNKAAAPKSALPVSLTTLALVFVGFMVTLLFGSMAMTTEAPTMAGTEIRQCTFEECKSSGCDASINPNLCVDPNGPFNGCNPEPWTEEACALSCSLTDCATQSAGEGDATCEGMQCPTDRCSTDYQLCGSDQPYQCLSGSAAMGCSDDPFGWPLVADTICGDCCDTRTC